MSYLKRTKAYPPKISRVTRNIGDEIGSWLITIGVLWLYIAFCWVFVKFIIRLIFGMDII